MEKGHTDPLLSAAMAYLSENDITDETGQRLNSPNNTDWSMDFRTSVTDLMENESFIYDKHTTEELESELGTGLGEEPNRPKSREINSGIKLTDKKEWKHTEILVASEVDEAKRRKLEIKRERNRRLSQQSRERARVRMEKAETAIINLQECKNNLVNANNKLSISVQGLQEICRMFQDEYREATNLLEKVGVLPPETRQKFREHKKRFTRKIEIKYAELKMGNQEIKLHSPSTSKGISHDKILK